MPLKDYQLKKQLTKLAFEATPLDSQIDYTKLPDVPETWLIELEAICRKSNLLLKPNPFETHVGDVSTYSSKKILTDQLKQVYRRLRGDFDDELKPLNDSQKLSLVSYLMEDITLCTPGFHNRVNLINRSFYTINTLAQLLFKLRSSLVDELAATLTSDVHDTNKVRQFARREGLGVVENLSTDPYTSVLRTQTIKVALQKKFQKEFSPFSLPFLLCNQLRTLIVEDGYVGKKSAEESYETKVAETFAKVVDGFLSNPLVQRKKSRRLFARSTAFSQTEEGERPFDFSTYFIVESDEDEIRTYIRDLNWPFIYKSFFQALQRDGYFNGSPVAYSLLDHVYRSLLCPESDSLQVIDRAIESGENFGNFLHAIHDLAFVDFIRIFTDKIKFCFKNGRDLCYLLQRLPEEVRSEAILNGGYDKDIRLLKGFYIDRWRNVRHTFTEIIKLLSPASHEEFIHRLGSDNIKGLFQTYESLHAFLKNNPKEICLQVINSLGEDAWRCCTNYTALYAIVMLLDPSIRLDFLLKGGFVNQINLFKTWFGGEADEMSPTFARLLLALEPQERITFIEALGENIKEVFVNFAVLLKTLRSLKRYNGTINVLVVAMLPYLKEIIHNNQDLQALLESVAESLALDVIQHLGDKMRHLIENNVQLRDQMLLFLKESQPQLTIDSDYHKNMSVPKGDYVDKWNNTRHIFTEIMKQLSPPSDEAFVKQLGSVNIKALFPTYQELYFFLNNNCKATVQPVISSLGEDLRLYCTNYADLYTIVMSLDLSIRLDFLLKSGFDKDIRLLKAWFNMDVDKESPAFAQLLLALDVSGRVMFIQALGKNIKEMFPRCMVFVYTLSALKNDFDVKQALVVAMLPYLNEIIHSHQDLRVLCMEVRDSLAFDIIKCLGDKMKGWATEGWKLRNQLCLFLRGDRLQFLTYLGYDKDIRLLKEFYVDSRKIYVDSSSTRRYTFTEIMRLMSPPSDVEFIKQLGPDNIKALFTTYEELHAFLRNNPREQGLYVISKEAVQQVINSLGEGVRVCISNDTEFYTIVMLLDPPIQCDFLLNSGFVIDLSFFKTSSNASLLLRNPENFFSILSCLKYDEQLVFIQNVGAVIRQIFTDSSMVLNALSRLSYYPQMVALFFDFAKEVIQPDDNLNDFLPYIEVSVLVDFIKGLGAKLKLGIKTGMDLCRLLAKLPAGARLEALIQGGYDKDVTLLKGMYGPCQRCSCKHSIFTRVLELLGQIHHEVFMQQLGANVALLFTTYDELDAFLHKTPPNYHEKIMGYLGGDVRRCINSYTELYTIVMLLAPPIRLDFLLKSGCVSDIPLFKTWFCGESDKKLLRFAQLLLALKPPMQVTFLEALGDNVREMFPNITLLAEMLRALRGDAKAIEALVSAMFPYLEGIIHDNQDLQILFMQVRDSLALDVIKRLGDKMKYLIADGREFRNGLGWFLKYSRLPYLIYFCHDNDIGLLKGFYVDRWNNTRHTFTEIMKLLSSCSQVEFIKHLGPNNIKRLFPTYAELHAFLSNEYLKEFGTEIISKEAVQQVINILGEDVGRCVTNYIELYTIVMLLDSSIRLDFLLEGGFVKDIPLLRKWFSSESDKKSPTFAQLLLALEPSMQITFLEVLGDNVREVFPNITLLVETLRALRYDAKAREALLAAMLPFLEKMIHCQEDFEVVLDVVETSQVLRVIKCLGNKAKHLLTLGRLVNQLSLLPAEYQLPFLSELGYDTEISLLILKGAYVAYRDNSQHIFAEIMRQLSPPSDAEFIRQLGPYNMKALFPTYKQLYEFLKGNRKEIVQQVIIILGENIKEVFPNCEVMADTLNAFKNDDDAKRALVVAMLPYLKEIIHDYKDLQILFMKVKGSLALDIVMSLGDKMKNWIKDSKQLRTRLAWFSEECRLPFLTYLGYDNDISLLKGFYVDRWKNTRHTFTEIMKLLSPPQDVEFIKQLGPDNIKALFPTHAELDAFLEKYPQESDLQLIGKEAVFYSVSAMSFFHVKNTSGGGLDARHPGNTI